MMQDEDLESGEDAFAANDAPRPWVVGAIRRQNRMFGIATFAALVGFVILLGTGTFQEREAQELGAYDADAGTVGTGADNGKMQEALDKLAKSGQNAKSWSGGKYGTLPTNPFHEGKVNKTWHRPHGGWGARQNRTKSISGQIGELSNLTAYSGSIPTSVPHVGALDDDEGSTMSLVNTSGNEPVSPPGWLSAKVTKKSGVMYEVVDQLYHDPDAFTQGLTFFNGRLYESTGLYRHSTVRELNTTSGEVIFATPLKRTYFGEGMAYYDGKLIQITWKAGLGLVYDANDLTKQPESFHYTTTKNNEGWGITYDPDHNELVVSDGSNNLMFWDPETYKRLRTLEVYRIDGLEPARKINELEYWRGRILANVWYEDVILVIDPVTGVVEKEYDFSELWPYDDRPRGTDCLNGISISSDPDVLFITGKKWNRLYKLRLLP